MSVEGKVHSIYISPERGGPMEKKIQVVAIQGKGLEGDRYAKGEGFWQTVKNPRDIIRHVSLITIQDINAANKEFGTNFKPEDTRRQIVIDGEVRLLSLIDKQFYVGNVLMRGVEECTPCKRPSQLSGKDNFERAFKADGRAGLRAEVLVGGVIFDFSYLIIPR